MHIRAHAHMHARMYVTYRVRFNDCHFMILLKQETCVVYENAHAENNFKRFVHSFTFISVFFPCILYPSSLPFISFILRFLLYYIYLIYIFFFCLRSSSFPFLYIYLSRETFFEIYISNERIRNATANSNFSYATPLR